MSVKPGRSYHSPQREEQATATRRRILEVAQSLFAERGFASVTMEAIAREAGASLASLYIYFPGKAAVVAALAEEIVSAPDLSVEQVEQEADPIRQLRTGAGILRRLNERSWAISELLRSAQGSDERLAAAWEQWRQRHLHAMRRATVALHAIGALREGLGVDEASDGLYALAGPDVYRALVCERGWPPDQYERWLFRMTCVELLGIAATHVPDDDRMPPDEV